jgi:hypothetical protein
MTSSVLFFAQVDFCFDTESLTVTPNNITNRITKTSLVGQLDLMQGKVVTCEQLSVTQAAMETMFELMAVESLFGPGSSVVDVCLAFKSKVRRLVATRLVTCRSGTTAAIERTLKMWC